MLTNTGRHRQVMAPGKYTELFFLDEATALAAGHRPCATCRRSRYEDFKTHWVSANPNLPAAQSGDIQKIDRHIHGERVDKQRQKRYWRARWDQLPDGTMVVEPGGRDALLRWRSKAFVWSAGGYGGPRDIVDSAEVDVLTPHSVVKAIGHGYVVSVHSSLSG